jgi:hypothetical protein
MVPINWVQFTQMENTDTSERFYIFRELKNDQINDQHMIGHNNILDIVT